MPMGLPLSAEPQTQQSLFRGEEEGRPLDGRCASVVLGDRVVRYALKQSRRRSIGLTIDHRGLRVGAPLRASQQEVERVIRQHQDWVLAKLEEWRQRAQAPALKLENGAIFPVLGEDHRLLIAVGSGRGFWGPGWLQLTVPPHKEAGPCLEKVLRERARGLFAERLAHYGALLGEAVPPLSLSSARTRWGSCSRLSGIRLNWRLIHFPLAVIDYVVAHELAHLREMNHSPRFWSVVEQIYPDYQEARAELKRLAGQLPRW